MSTIYGMPGRRLPWTRLLLALLLVWPRVAAAETVIVPGNHAPPYRIIEGDDFYGIYFDVMKEIGRRLGLEVHFVETPFKRALSMMRQGDADIMLGPNRNPEREGYMAYTKAFFPPAGKVFYVYPGTAPITSYEDLAGKRIAVLAGARYFERFDADGSLRKVQTPDYVVAMEKVLTGECDVVVMPVQLGDYLLAQENIDLEKSPYIVPGGRSYITISNKSKVLALQNDIEQALAAIKAEGVMEEILERYR